MKRLLMKVLFVAFAGIQIGVTISGAKIYPFNAYQMFSKHWPDGVVMSQIRVLTLQGESFRPWEIIKIPFFQANQIMYSAFLEEDFRGRDQVCGYLQSLRGSVEIMVDDVEYRRTKKGLVAKTLATRPLANCSDVRPEKGAFLRP